MKTWLTCVLAVFVCMPGMHAEEHDPDFKFRRVSSKWGRARALQAKEARREAQLAQREQLHQPLPEVYIAGPSKAATNNALESPSSGFGAWIPPPHDVVLGNPSLAEPPRDFQGSWPEAFASAKGRPLQALVLKLKVPAAPTELAVPPEAAALPDLQPLLDEMLEVVADANPFPVAPLAQLDRVQSIEAALPYLEPFVRHLLEQSDAYRPHAEVLPMLTSAESYSD
jgi:hypothetical protein